MVKRKKRNSILIQVAMLFLVAIMVSGIATFIAQRYASFTDVKEGTEAQARTAAKNVESAIKEYTNYQWLLGYWHDHWDELDIEYDVEFKKRTETEEKNKKWMRLHPSISAKYADFWDIRNLPEDEQKLYAEICYSWLTTRINEIKRNSGVSFLFCVMTDNTYENQFFLLSGADPGQKRGEKLHQVYRLGKFVDTPKEQVEGMKSARQSSAHLTFGNQYADYYYYMGMVDDYNILVGTSINIQEMRQTINTQTARNTAYAAGYMILLAALCLLLLNYFVLRPLKKVQKNIQVYKETKESEKVISSLAEVRNRNEIGQLSGDVSALVKEIDDYVSRIETITAEKERIGAELSLASRIQTAMLPNTFPPYPDQTEFDIYASMDPAKEVGGDFYDFFFVDDDHLCMIMADISGKGIPAALMMMASKIVLENYGKMGKSPAAILADCNEAICANNSEEMFITVWLGILELSTGKMTASNAGHEYPILMEAGGRYELYKDKHGFVIGGMPGMKYTEYVIDLTPGSRIFLYTDGVPEATDEDKNMFGLERTLEALNSCCDCSPAETLKAVRGAVDSFVKGAEQFDDLTMMCLEYKG